MVVIVGQSKIYNGYGIQVRRWKILFILLLFNMYKSADQIYLSIRLLMLPLCYQEVAHLRVR